MPVVNFSEKFLLNFKLVLKVFEELSQFERKHLKFCLHFSSQSSKDSNI